MKKRPGYRTLWAFDFDGTLSPIVSARSEARIHPACRSFLSDLARTPENLVAVLSSRSLADLVPRVPVRRVFLGGGSGLEWRLPGGHRLRPGREAEEKREEARRTVAPLLEEIAGVPGTDIEDKYWSIAVHFRNVPPDDRSTLRPLLRAIRQNEKVRAFDGPAVAEIQLLPEVNKSLGLRTLCHFLRFDPSNGRIFYAGDDENDGIAMRWVLSRKGTALSVGPRPRVPGARVVGGPASLARAVRFLADLPA